MPNARRGEAALHLGGQTYTLCLTLGALAELESGFGAGDLAELGGRLESGRLSGRDLITLLGAALRGGGHDLTDAQVAALPVANGLNAIVAALGELFLATFGDTSQNPTTPPRER